VVAGRSALFEDVEDTKGGVMLNCMLSGKGRRGCVNLHPEYYGKCRLNYVSGHLLTGKESCDQYEEEPRRCEICGADAIPVYLASDNKKLAMNTVLCVHCYAIYDSITRSPSIVYTNAMEILKALVERARANEQQGR